MYGIGTAMKNNEDDNNFRNDIRQLSAGTGRSLFLQYRTRPAILKITLSK